jgi:sporulation protein YlmC with PRC-barrel domain
MRLSELLEKEVMTESGAHLGRVYDVRGSLTPRTLGVVGLAVGTAGLLERLGRGPKRGRRAAQPKSLIRWSAIVDVGEQITVRDGTEPE